ncbi:TauD/TfdA family dioxygenase [Streptomyces sp. NPDC001137]|uniref:TauD/TfdA family dioxygenase n=1 Tax=Streptomyces sp. NPDC001137 TaxID=3154378 RepID=UPI0033237D44
MTAALDSTLPRSPGRSLGVQLTDDDRSAVEALAQGFVHNGAAPLDSPEWQEQARLASCQLPARLTQAIRRYRHDAGSAGTLSVTNLPIVTNVLPPTPHAPDSVERAATTPATVAVLLAQQLGEVIAYRDEKQGALVQNVVPIRSLSRSQSNGGSVPLEFHTENAFHPNRPDFVGLLCLRPAHEGGVGTYVASIRQALPLLEDKDRAILRESRFVTAAPPSFRSADRTAPHPLLSGDADDPDICVDFYATTALDETAAVSMERLRVALMSVRTGLVLRPGDMVFLDNRLVVHGRGAFTPRYDGTDRWLHRVFVHLDNRRSRPRRTGGGAVLV